MKLDLQLFEGGHSVTVYKDANITTASADKTSDVAKDAEVTLTITPATNKIVDQIIVVAGGVTVDEDYKFDMGEADVVIYVTGKADDTKDYMVTEPCYICVNGAVTKIAPNVKLKISGNGAIYGAEAVAKRTITQTDQVAALIEAGVIVPVNE